MHGQCYLIKYAGNKQVSIMLQVSICNRTHAHSYKHNHTRAADLCGEKAVELRDWRVPSWRIAQCTWEWSLWRDLWRG